MTTELWVAVIAADSLTLFLLWILPTLSRPDLFFGVTVQQDFRESPEGRGILRRYRWIVLLSGAVATGVLFPPAKGLGIVASVLLLAGGGVFAWAVSHRSARGHAAAPSTERLAVFGGADEPPSPRGGLAGLGPFLVLSSAAAYGYWHYDLLPDPLPVHWNGSSPTRFVPKTLLAVLEPFIVATGICFIMEIIKWSQANRSLTRRLTLTGGETQEPAFHQMSLRALLIVQYMIAAMFTWNMVVRRGPHLSHVIPQQWAFYGSLFITLAPLPYLIYLSTHYGQGGWKLTSDGAAPDAQPAGDRTPDECWKLGQFYYNPEDPAMWVQGRTGVGYALNFARPLSWVLLLSLALGPLVILWLTRR